MLTQQINTPCTSPYDYNHPNNNVPTIIKKTRPQNCSISFDGHNLSMFILFNWFFSFGTYGYLPDAGIYWCLRLGVGAFKKEILIPFRHVYYFEYNNSITPVCLSNMSSPFHTGPFSQCANSSALGNDGCSIIVMTGHPIVARVSAGTLLLSQNKDDIILIVVTGRPIVAGAIAGTRCCPVKMRMPLPPCYYA
jgi:hypothetical protein